MYFKAEICLSTEELELNSDGNYEGCNPDTFTDHGVIETIKRPNLNEITRELGRRYGLRDAEIHENRIEVQFEGEHDYRTPVEERIPFIETYTIYISKVTECGLNNDELEQVLNKVKGA